MSENGERSLIHEALRDLRVEVRGVSSEVAELRVEVSAMGVDALTERLKRVEDIQDTMRDRLTCLVQTQRSLRKQFEKWLPYAIMAALGGAELTDHFSVQAPNPVAPASASETR
ncbi:MAG: hypothetical protein Unbinned2514contig1000_12 [Prokaryotic dsDNA virus sp.]|nr:MAG: hypothetical protein Unbinned2514contig1000_12 [Prokaryotic dsDNA virus sp.]